jgi:hypothetical protein
MPRPSARPEARTLDSDNSLSGAAVREWITLRKETLQEKVSAHDVLRHFGVALKFGGSEHREQIPCPFHDDTKPSARVFPNEGIKSPSALYCFTCFGGKRKDIFALWKAFKGDEGMKFTQVLRGLEEAFGIETPKSPTFHSEVYESNRGPSEDEVEVRDLLGVCERRLRDAKPTFKLEGFLVVGQCLDRLQYRIEKGRISISDAKSIIRKILDKISEKIRASAA